MSYKIFAKIFICGFLFIIMVFLLAQKINLTTADLGRHIKNGEILWNNIDHNFWHSKVMSKNTYSYTNPKFPSPNHHWGSGILFYLIYIATGFIGLHLFYIFLLVAAFALVFWVCVKISGFKNAVLAGLLIVPLIAYRNEVRPEGFTYLFSAIFITILYYWTQIPKTKLIWLLPFIQLLWVNSHIYFFLGPVIIVTFLINTILQGESLYSTRIPLVGLGLSIVASLISPFGLTGVIYPFTIFSNYGYRVLENQTVWFLQNLHIYNPAYVLFEIVAGLIVLILCSIGAYRIIYRSKNTHATQIPPWMLFLALGGIVMGLFAVRNFAIFGLFTLPLLSYACAKLFSGRFEWLKTPPVYASIFILLFCGSFFLFYNSEVLKNNTRGLGLLPHSLDAGEFIKTQNIQGPVFNNYDVGGYLIFALYPEEKVFVDNRPESYPKEFFPNAYIPMQENESIWQKQEGKYGFNAIIFNYHDATPWAQNFLVSRLNDASWAPVYADSYILILLKRNSLNQNIIERFELSKSLFRFH